MERVSFVQYEHADQIEKKLVSCNGCVIGAESNSIGLADGILSTDIIPWRICMSAINGTTCATSCRDGVEERVVYKKGDGKL